MTRPVKMLFIGNSILGWKTYTNQLSSAMSAHEGLEGTTYQRRPGRFATAPVKRHDITNPLWRMIRKVDPIDAYRSWLGRNIRRAVRQHRPDIVHFAAHWPAAAMIDMPDRPPFTLSLDCTRANIEDDFGFGIWNAAERQREADMLALASRIYPMSTWAAKSLRLDYNLCETAIRLMPPCQDLAGFRPRIAHSGLPNLLFIGNDFTRKGGKDLVEWVTGPLAGTCRLHIVSSDPAAQVQGPSIIAHGPMPHADLIGKLMPQMDILCLPTQLDMSPHVLVEAAAAGLPAVASNLGGISDLVLHRKTGLLVPPDQPDGFILALRELIGSRDLRCQMGKAALDHAKTTFDASRVLADKLDDISSIARLNITHATGSENSPLYRSSQRSVSG